MPPHTFLLSLIPSHQNVVPLLTEKTWRNVSTQLSMLFAYVQILRCGSVSKKVKVKGKGRQFV